jgi:hypothetical protein
MKKRPAILASAAILAVCVFGQPNKAANQKQQVSQQANQALIGPGATNKHKNGQTNETKPDPDAPDWYAALERPDWWLVIVAALTGAVICWQSIETRKAAKACKEAAQAALLNAQAVINAERAWLTVTIADELSPLQILPLNRVENERRQMRRILAGKAVSIEEDGEDRMCYISIQNQGRTPAKIVGGSSAHCFIDRPGNLPVPADYSKPIFLPDPTFIVNRDSFKIHPGFKPDFILKRDRTPEEVGYVTDFLMLYGRVVYEDVFALPDGSSGTHETRWCFAYRPGEEKMFVACGPTEYNGHT